MTKTFRCATALIILAGLVASGFLAAGCKKNQPNQPAATTTQPSVAAVAPEVAMNRKGMAYTETQAYDEAIQEFTQAIAKYPNFEWSYSNRAAVFITQKKFDEALSDLKKAAEINPKNPVVHYNLASLYSLRNNIDLSLASLDRALELGFKDYAFLDKDPDLGNARKNKGFRKILNKHKANLPR